MEIPESVIMCNADANADANDENKERLDPHD
jgi:hypothetical protein